MKLEQPKTKHPITLTIQDLDITFIAAVQEKPDGSMGIIDLVLEGSTDLQVRTLLLDYSINNQAYDQIEAIYKEAK